MLIKFPCTYFLEWKTNNNQQLSEGRVRPSAVNSRITFQETLTLQTEMLFDNNKQQFFKKDTLLNVNLVSKARPDQIKLVGRVALDLSKVANQDAFSTLDTHPLSYCSVQGQITFSVAMKASKLTNKSLQDLDRSSYK